MTVAEAQANVTAANEIYLALVRATRPLSRTSKQQEEIDWAYHKLESAKFWLTMAKQEERNNA